MIINWLRIDKAEKTKSRKFPLLPRIGLIVDIGGKKISYRHAPMVETILNLLERGPSLNNLQRIIMEQISEIDFSHHSSTRRTVNTTAKTLSRSVKGKGGSLSKP